VKSVLALPRGSVVSLLTFSLFTNLLMLTVPLYMLQVFDRVLSSRSVETLWMLSIIAIGALVTAGCLEVVRNRLLLKLSNRIYGLWSKPLLSGFGQGTTAESVARLKDLGDVRGFVGGGGLLPALDAPWIPLYLLILFAFDPAFGWVAIVGGLVIAGIVIVSEMRLRAAIGEAQGSSTAAMSQADLISRGADSLRAMGMTERIVEGWSERSVDSLRKSFVVSAQLAQDNAAAKFVRTAVQIIVLGTAAYLVTLGELTPGVMIAGSILITRALAPLEGAISGWRPMIHAFHAYQRVSEAVLRAKPQRLRDGHNFRGKISLDRVTLVANRQNILNNINLSIEAGEMIGITGNNGSGKTTLVRTIVGLSAPTVGKVLLDDVDYGRYDINSLGPHVGYLPQTPLLFGGSVGQNIARLNADATAAQINEAGRRAHSHEYFSEFADGYDTDVQASFISQGQVQRIALARALFGDVRLVVLDEPETHLDAPGEKALANTITALKQAHITTVLVSHRQELLALCDRIVVMKGGIAKVYQPGKPADETTSANLAPGAAQSANSPSNVASIAARKETDQRGEAGKVAEQRTKRRVVVKADKPVKKPLPTHKEIPPDPEVLAKNKAAIDEGRFTLADFLDSSQGSLGLWVESNRGKVGQRYLRQLRKRFEPVLPYKFSMINDETIRSWRIYRQNAEGASSSIEKAMLKKRFTNDVEALKQCLNRAVEWGLVPAHPLLSAAEKVSKADG
jgi:ATP-binding cassette subfamily B protein/ATP-binding cassette subfamily C protein